MELECETSQNFGKKKNSQNSPVNNKQQWKAFVSAVDFIMSNMMHIVVYRNNMDSIMVQQTLALNIRSCMSLVTRKPVFGVCNQVRLKPGCTTSEASYSLEISGIETRDIILSRQWTTKADEQADLRLCCSQRAKTGFLMTGLVS